MASARAQAAYRRFSPCSCRILCQHASPSYLSSNPMEPASENTATVTGEGGPQTRRTGPRPVRCRTNATGHRELFLGTRADGRSFERSYAHWVEPFAPSSFLPITRKVNGTYTSWRRSLLCGSMTSW